jgi:hypothetical protein
LTEPAGAAVVVEGASQGFDTVVLFLEDGSILRVPGLALWAVLAEQGLRRLGQVFVGMIEVHPFLVAVESLVVVGIVPQDPVPVAEQDLDDLRVQLALHNLPMPLEVLFERHRPVLRHPSRVEAPQPFGTFLILGDGPIEGKCPDHGILVRRVLRFLGLLLVKQRGHRVDQLRQLTATRFIDPRTDWRTEHGLFSIHDALFL